MNKNNSKWIVLAAVAFVVVLLFAGGCSTYNGMVTAEETVNKAWANVQSSYQRRLDLIPNLVETVKGYAKHESSTYENVTAARAGASKTVEKAGEDLLSAKDAVSSFNGPDSSAPTAEQYSNLDKAYGIYINAVHEAYPQLMANENFLDLQKQLEGTENRINTERNRYNEEVQTYNVKIRRFPANIFAGIFGFDTKQMFAADQGAQNAPKVSFD
jgi:LemA protein